MLEHYIVTRSGQLINAIIIEHFAIEQERVALVHANMPESIEGIGGFIIKSTIAVHENAVVTELYITHQNLCSTMYPIIKEKTIGMHKMYFAVGGRPLPGSSANRCYCHNQTEAEEQGRT